MVFKHTATGSGMKTETSSCIYDWSTGNNGEKPEYAKSYPSDKITHRWPEPKGENFSRNDKTPPAYSKSGSNFPVKVSKTAAPHVVASGQVGKGTGGSAKGDRGVRYVDGFGNAKYRGKSG
jgi:hypothetical protein